MLSESFRTAEADMAARSLREAQVDADRLLRGDGVGARRPTATCLSADERGAIDALMREAGRGRARATTASPSRPRVKALGDGTEAFAAERMNRGIRRALAGRRVEDV